MNTLTLSQLENLFFAHEYDKIPSNLPEFNFYCRKELQGVNVLHVIDYRPGLYISEDQYAHLKGQIIEFFRARGEREVHVMTLILCAEVEKAARLGAQDPFCWVIDAVSHRLLVYENRTADFYGWRGLLEDYLYSLPQEASAPQEPIPGASAGIRWPKVTAPVSLFLVVCNVAVFLICTFTGDLLYNKGALGVKALLRGGQGYRLFASMFLHWNVEHLISNMVVLYYVGSLVERELGPLPYGALYLLSGLAGNVFSVGYELLTGIYGSSAGASGAVFGVEGALLFLAMAHRSRWESMSLGRVAFAVAFSLYCGFTSAGVNNAAHVGGLLAGFLAAAVIAVCKRIWHFR